MFQSLIYVRIPEEFTQPVISIMNKTCPKEITSIFSDTNLLNLSFRIQVVVNKPLTKLDQICEAPHLLLYFFTCVDKNDFIKNQKINFLNFSKENKRAYVPVMPIYINNSKNSKGKPKIFMQNSFISFMQSEIPNLQVIEIKAKGFASKSGFNRLWPSLVGQIVQSVSTRITTIRSQIGKQKISFDTFRHALRLCTIYDSISCFDKTFEVINNSEKLIAKNRKMFKYIEPKALTYRFDFCVGVDNVETKIFTEDPTEYDLHFIFLKRRIQDLLCLGKNNEAISYAFKFFVKSSTKIKPLTEISDYIYRMWVAQALGDISTQCAKEMEMNESANIPQYASILEWYLRSLPEARNSFRERSRRISFIENALIKDPLQITETEKKPPRDEKTGQIGDFMILENILTKRDRFNSEITRTLLSLIKYYTRNGFSRSAAVAMSKLSSIVQDDTNEYSISSMLTIIKKGYSHLLPVITDKILESIPFDDRAFACCKIITDQRSKYREVAVNFLSDMLTKSDPKQAFKTSYNLPIKLSIDLGDEAASGCASDDNDAGDKTAETADKESDKESDAIIQGEKASVRLKVHCGFNGHLRCNRLRVGFLNSSIVRICYLECHDADLYDGAVITVSNAFSKPGAFTIYNLKLACLQEQVLSVILPPSREFVHVDPAPLPFDFEIEAPGVLLPRRVQLANLDINVVRDVESLSFKVSGGVSFRLANLLLGNGEKRAPEKGLNYSNVPSGVHQINLPISPVVASAGSLKIEAIANNQSIVREVKFKVSEFLEFKLHFRKLTKVAQLSAFVKSKSDLIITSIDFFDKESNNKIVSKNIGIPLKVGLTPASALFFLDTEPGIAKVWVKQNGMKEFMIRVNVEILDEDSMKKNDEELVELAPLTILSPKDFSL